jgi:hypothetical protein
MFSKWKWETNMNRAKLSIKQFCFMGVDILIYLADLSDSEICQII